MRVPLGLLTSEGFSECPAAFSDGASVSDFERFLGNRDQPITGIVSPKRLDEILERLVITRQQLQQSLTQEPLPNSQFKIDCLLGQHCLEKAKELLGQSHECIVRIYSIPPELPGRYSDGEICRKVLLLHQQQPSLAQKWLERLSAGKRKHVTMVFHRDEIWSAMRQVAVFPGLWHDIKLGNWAKHLAAHIDGQITTYWRHIYRVWNDVIFSGVDPSLRQCLDAYSARSLQFMAPAWSEKDQEAIREKMKNGTLFCNISGEEERSKLLRNILTFEGVIPSILTFHENMRYLTVGAKILERYIEVKRPTEKAKPSIAPLKTPESLLSNLTQDWGQQLPVLNVVECTEGRYQSIDTGLQPLGAFAQLMLAALRSFPLLSSETPLQDIKGIGMNAFADAKSRSRLCEMASSVGFWNEKIEKGLALPDQDVPREIPDMIMFQTGWRGGLPTISVFSELRTKSFLPTLLLTAKNEKGKEPTAALIQFDFVCAFFGPFVFNVDQSHAGLSIEELRNRPIFNDSTIVLDDPDPMTDAPGLDVTPSMGWAEGGAPFTSEPLTATTNKHQQPRAKQSGPTKTRRQKAMRDPSAKKPEKIITKPKPPKRIEPKNLFGKTPMPSVPEGMDTTLDNPEVPEASQRISTPQVDGIDLSQHVRPQHLPANPPVEQHTGPHFEPDAEPDVPHETELEVPESRQRISAPNLHEDAPLAQDMSQPVPASPFPVMHEPRPTVATPETDAMQGVEIRVVKQDLAREKKRQRLGKGGPHVPDHAEAQLRIPDRRSGQEEPAKVNRTRVLQPKSIPRPEEPGPVDGFNTLEPEIPERHETRLEAPAPEEEEV
ncbi:DUF3723 domain-containing protein [Fusarium mundagurra]|uniref:DUF3723 domain-containing protein n=1 Tax=Fusarium mundagurra TaxID=1567541 RepID=A0A8H6DPN6_9HYPO|nr:DUF3723 domain-containing protein [Fusarium mundagurra]